MQRIRGTEIGEDPIAFDADGTYLLVKMQRDPLGNVYRVVLETGARELWKTLKPEDPGGVLATFAVRVSRDHQAYAYSYNRFLSELYLVTGLD